jgi:hypothetical protein
VVVTSAWSAANSGACERESFSIGRPWNTDLYSHACWNTNPLWPCS